ncbi:hypothetical protein Amet_2374 [Alkaliphilus metalliredigens QYMF]|uniref:Uncharacterized protein n=1 Tax=Alkaliphilus metalliredigens (strain QYMF) TaxID=293826 RepID=A6TQR0_ALKMQ|nr:hypothetical protein [Alkaliphilus metalliredigens]ABR48528.1 hypothetical protein Amet_2374 [Alkaliphilus metalliredigens QYMF]
MHDQFKKPINDEEEEIIKFKKMIMGELKALIEKVENFNGIISDVDEGSNRLILISLKKFNGELPKEVGEAIKKHGEQGWGSQNQFYVMTNRKRVVGYLGINLYEEPMPFGKYVYIFALQLEKKYQSQINLKYIENFISAVARKAQCNYVDMTDDCCPLALDKVKHLGFVEFTSTSLFKLNKQNSPIDFEMVSSQNINISEIEGTHFIPSDRRLPLQVQLNQWKEENCTIEKFVINKNQGQTPLTLLIIKRLGATKKNGTKNFYTFLAEPIVFYDDQLTNEVINIIINILGEKEQEEAFMIALPTACEVTISKYHWDYKLESVKWYRKMVSNHYKQL